MPCNPDQILFYKNECLLLMQKNLTVASKMLNFLMFSIISNIPTVMVLVIVVLVLLNLMFVILIK